MRIISKQIDDKNEIQKYKLDQFMQKNQSKFENNNEKKKELSKIDKLGEQLIKKKHGLGDEKVVSN